LSHTPFCFCQLLLCPCLLLSTFHFAKCTLTVPMLVLFRFSCFECRLCPVFFGHHLDQ
jgi:hypothetical protein